VYPEFTPGNKTTGPETVAVTTAVKRVLGATSWAGDSPHSSAPRVVTVTNNSTANDIYLKTVPSSLSLTGAVSSTSFEDKIAASDGVARNYYLNPNEDLVVIASASATNVTASENLVCR
jgi:hypothetical protein